MTPAWWYLSQCLALADGASAGRSHPCYLGWWPERRKPTQNRDPRGRKHRAIWKAGVTWRLTGHLDEMRSWPNRGVTGREEMWASCSHWRPGTLEQLLGMVAVRENRCEVPSMLGTKEAFHN